MQRSARRQRGGVAGIVSGAHGHKLPAAARVDITACPRSRDCLGARHDGDRTGHALECGGATIGTGHERHGSHAARRLLAGAEALTSARSASRRPRRRDGPAAAAAARARLRGAARVGFDRRRCSAATRRARRHLRDEFAQRARGTSRGRSVYAATGLVARDASGRVSFVLGLQGPCASFDTACSASLVRAPRRHARCSARVRRGAGRGVNLMLLPASERRHARSRA